MVESGVCEEKVYEREKAGVREEMASFWTLAEAKTGTNECLDHGRVIAF